MSRLAFAEFCRGLTRPVAGGNLSSITLEVSEMRELLKVIEVSVADARQAEELLANGARSTIAVDPELVLARFSLWQSMRKVRVVREMPRRGLTSRANAA